MTDDSTVSPNPLAAGWSIITTLVKVRPPDPRGDETVDHTAFGKILGALEGNVMARLPDLTEELDRYVGEMEGVDPDRLGRLEALAYWVNLYNAAALGLGAVAARGGASTVFGVPGAFTKSLLTVAGEELSLDRIEHGKVRRFRDPRIHAALVCGAMSCPTLRREPYTAEVDRQLDDPMVRFLAAGAFRIEPETDAVVLSPIFKWFGRDFVSPTRMPTILPASRRSVLAALGSWLDPPTVGWIETVRPSIRFSEYDWGLGCVIA